jgi:hypothetical protein
MKKEVRNRSRGDADHKFRGLYSDSMKPCQSSQQPSIACQNLS